MHCSRGVSENWVSLVRLVVLPVPCLVPIIGLKISLPYSRQGHIRIKRSNAGVSTARVRFRCKRPALQAHMLLDYYYVCRIVPISAGVRSILGQCITRSRTHSTPLKTFLCVSDNPQLSPRHARTSISIDLRNPGISFRHAGPSGCCSAISFLPIDASNDLAHYTLYRPVSTLRILLY